MSLDAFWASIDRALDQIAAEKPDTFDGVKAALDANGNPDRTETQGADAAFFGGSGGDRTLWGVLAAAGWVTVWAEASYYYVAQHPATGEILTYTEGDVQRGDVTGRAL